MSEECMSRTKKFENRYTIASYDIALLQCIIAIINSIIKVSYFIRILILYITHYTITLLYIIICIIYYKKNL
jgi:hypothetical protein